MTARFIARWPSGAVDRHELPQAVAAEFAEQLRAVGVTIVWAPIATPSALAGPSKAARKAERREQRRQLRELGAAA